jgi:hypothetical protein
VRSGLPGSAAWVSLQGDPIDQLVDPGGRWMSRVLATLFHTAAKPIDQPCPLPALPRS